MDALPPPAARGNPLSEVLEGFAYPLRAVSFLSRHRLWRLAVLPLAINAALLLALAGFAWGELLPLLSRAQDSLVAMSGDAPVVALGVSFLKWLAWLFLLPVVLALSTVVVIVVGEVVASPFLDALSERVDALNSGRGGGSVGSRRWFAALGMAVTDTFWALFFFGVFYVPAVLVGWVPAVGVALSLGCLALFMAHAFVGLPMARYGVSFRRRWRLVLNNVWRCGAFGLVLALGWTIPGLNLLLLPVAAVAGTLLFCDLRAAGRLGELR